MGRHALPDSKKRKATLGVAVTASELAKYHAAAKERGLKLAEMVRQAVARFLGEDVADETADENETSEELEAE